VIASRQFKYILTIYIR